MADTFLVPAASTSAAVTPGAITGQNPVPFGAALLGFNTGAADLLTTNDLSVGDPGDAGGLSEFAVEFWFKPTGAYPGVNRAIAQGPRSATVGAVEWFFNFNTTGTVTFAACDETGTNRSAVSAAISIGDWHHIVGTTEGTNVRIYVDNVVVSSATWGGHTVRVMGAIAGTLTVVLTGSPVGTDDYRFDELAFYRAALTSTRVSAHYDAGVSRGFPAQDTEERVIAALDQVGSTAPRSIGTGTRNVIPVYMTGQSPLEEARLAVEAEDVDAALFVTADGTIKFLPDGHRSSSPYNTVQATFGDAGGSEIPYEGLEVDYSPTFLINEWNVVRSPSLSISPVLQTVSDSTSISRYFKRSHTLSDVPCTLDADAATIAASLLAKYKDPMQRITSISFSTVDASVTEAVLERELMDKIRILRTPPGGGSRIDQSVFIQSIEVSGANDGNPWQVKWGVSPL